MLFESDTYRSHRSGGGGTQPAHHGRIHVLCRRLHRLFQDRGPCQNQNSP